MTTYDSLEIKFLNAKALKRLNAEPVTYMRAQSMQHGLK